ncbi:MAG: pyridoxal phosphate-dependent aminotransferase [Epsilonproteobacteria bacterium]|nr:pyridoxal phosphate-dependent aminotransferase [Campylobacterota bacterium]
MLNLPFSEIKRIEELVRGDKDNISLSQGALKLGGIPLQIKQHVQTLLSTDITDYYGSCWGLDILRERLAQTLSARYHTKLTTDQILPTHGCIGGLSILYLSILAPGDEVIIPEPSYPAYRVLAQAARANVVTVSCLEDDNFERGVSWQFDIEKIKAATTSKTRMIVFSNPCNPTGYVISAVQIRQLLEWCAQKGIYLVVDEAYADYIFEGDFTSSLALLNESEWLVSAHTFSKNFAMSGWRVGFLAAHPKLIKALVGMQDALLNCLNNSAQYAALYALDHPEIVQSFYQQVKENRNRAVELLEPVVAKGLIKYSYPNAGFYIFLKTRYDRTADVCMDILQSKKVSLVPGSGFGDSVQSFIRVCFAREKDLLEKGLTRLTQYLLKEE